MTARSNYRYRHHFKNDHAHVRKQPSLSLLFPSCSPDVVRWIFDSLYAMVIAAFIFVAAATLSVHSYIPASPTNDTQATIAGGLNVTDTSKLHLKWYPSGSVSMSAC